MELFNGDPSKGTMEHTQEHLLMPNPRVKLRPRAFNNIFRHLSDANLPYNKPDRFSHRTLLDFEHFKAPLTSPTVHTRM